VSDREVSGQAQEAVPALNAEQIKIKQIVCLGRAKLKKLALKTNFINYKNEYKAYKFLSAMHQ
jgi:hypothetical protein